MSTKTQTTSRLSGAMLKTAQSKIGSPEIETGDNPFAAALRDIGGSEVPKSDQANPAKSDFFNEFSGLETKGGSGAGFDLDAFRKMQDRKGGFGKQDFGLDNEVRAKKEAEKQAHLAKLKADEKKQKQIFDARQKANTQRVAELKQHFQKTATPAAKKRIGSAADDVRLSPITAKSIDAAQGTVAWLEHLIRTANKFNILDQSAKQANTWATTAKKKRRQIGKGGKGMHAMLAHGSKTEQRRAITAMENPDAGVPGE